MGPGAERPFAAFSHQTRRIDEIYQAALAEGSIITLWHGGDEKNHWKKEGALFNYAPANFGQIYPVFKGADAAYAGLFVFAWSIQSNTNNDDDAVLRHSSVATFTSGHSFQSTPSYNYPTEGTFVSWAQIGAILKDTPHPEGAKLLHIYLLSDEYQKNVEYSTRQDVLAPPGAENILVQPNTNAPEFAACMADRTTVGRLRFFFEDRIGTAQGLSPLEDDL
ncbi:hypothetical protein BU25DRAFT_433840 [Macroventuria anomochaeta]|uniref:Uncharacterized protein n=1 Tax=Macroventuria anomochaeta TaxID=301207 RepID=A0ACB6RT03_9PLEO|nr:uncharacterized protein BU25DRAFT_433840 [Macroventuria anomochaeta]KAF2624054.1 hypothetical protein BU25DRAFT_433840 [Macroventuria anomochaeta]